MREVIIESFGVEYKLSTSEIQACVREYRSRSGDLDEITQRYKSLWPPSYEIPDISKVDIDRIPEKVTIPVYFLQSHKDESRDSIEPYSLKRLILRDLANNRNAAKAEMKKCLKEGEMVGFKRFNAMQNAYKVVSNSFYGVLGASTFAGYDPDVAGAITWCARQTIGQLTDIIESKELFCDKEFITEIEDFVKHIEKLGDSFLSIRQLPKEEYSRVEKHRRLSIGRLFDIDGALRRDITIYSISKPSSSLVYQDTDSNYYVIRAVQSYYTGCDENGKGLKRCDPTIIREMMNTMIDFNEIAGAFFEKCINVFPLSVSFEGSFVVARHLNRKKKYMGKKACDDDGVVYSDKLKYKEAYDENGFLIEDYDKYWHAKETLVPRSDGTYMIIDNRQLIDNHVHYFDYIGSMGIKCTGVDIVRRDQYRFINYFHLEVMRNDLKICKYNGQDKTWSPIDIDTPIEQTVRDILRNFYGILNSYSKIATLISCDKPSIEFTLDDFSKQVTNNGSKNPALLDLNKRLKLENKEKYIVDIEQKYSFVVVGDIESEKRISMGFVGKDSINGLRRTIDELVDETKSKFNEEWFIENNKFESLTYDYFINACCISRLNSKYYITKLASALALYVFGDMFPDISKQIDEGTIENSGIVIDRYQKKIGKLLIDEFYPSNPMEKREAKKLEESLSGGNRNRRKPLPSELDEFLRSEAKNPTNNYTTSDFRIIGIRSLEVLEKRKKALHYLILNTRRNGNTPQRVLLGEKLEMELYHEASGSNEELRRMYNEVIHKIELWREYEKKYSICLETLSE